MIRILSPLYADLSQTIHNIFEVGIDSPENDLQAKILEALTPDNMKISSAATARSHVDLDAEMARYLTAISGCRGATYQHTARVSKPNEVEKKPKISSTTNKSQHTSAGAHNKSKVTGKKRKISRRLICFRCGLRGHMALECRSWRQQLGCKKAGRYRIKARKGR